MALSLSTNAATKRPRRVSPAQSQVQETISGLSRMFKALPMSSKSKWQGAANELNGSLNRTGRHKMSPANAFSTTNSARLSASLPIISEPILPILGPPVLGGLLLQSRIVDGHFTLALSASQPVTDYLIVQSAPPVIAGRTSYASSSFTNLGAIPGISGSTDIASLFTAKYGVPEESSAIALRLYAVSASGIRSSGVVVTTVCLNAAASGTLGDDNSLHIAA